MEQDLYKDRTDAGKKLADILIQKKLIDPIVIGLPRGGVPIAYEVAQKLNAPMDVLVVRKIGAPLNPEYALGAITEKDDVYLNNYAIERTHTTQEQLKKIIGQKKEEIQSRINLFRKGKDLIDIKNKTVILIDDGIATGATAQVAINYLKKNGAKRLIFAAPVGSQDGISKLAKNADEVVCPLQPSFFLAVGDWYRVFNQVSDNEVAEILEKYNAKKNRYESKK